MMGQGSLWKSSKHGQQQSRREAWTGAGIGASGQSWEDCAVVVPFLTACP